MATHDAKVPVGHRFHTGHLLDKINQSRRWCVLEGEQNGDWRKNGGQEVVEGMDLVDPILLNYSFLFHVGLMPTKSVSQT